MARQVVHDDDVARLKVLGPELTHILGEDGAVHRGIDHQGSDDAAACQACEEGRGLPMSVGCVALYPLSARTASITAHHIGCSSGLIDEDETLQRRMGWRSRHASRAKATSALSCSAACTVFCEAETFALEEAP